ncbi:MAG TPA: helix-turn-helix domain-containing protein [Ktedonobacteraceae bacterium]|nr:helix-turn-helix domain-containing protein [Ktedonobacteraceae bacterium]
MVRAKQQAQEPVTLPDEIWGVEQVCNFLKVGRTKFYELLKEGLPSRWVGKRRRFDQRDIALWWEKQRDVS